MGTALRWDWYRIFTELMNLPGNKLAFQAKCWAGAERSAGYMELWNLELWNYGIMELWHYEIMELWIAAPPR